MPAVQLLPSTLQGSHSDLLMRQQLGESLSYLVDECSQQLTPSVQDPLTKAALALKAGSRLHPVVFARYAQWVQALVTDNHELADEAVTGLLAAAQQGEAYAPCISLGDASLADDKSLIIALMMAGNDGGLGFTAPDEEAAARTWDTLQQAWGLAEHLLPELAGEMQALIAQTILVGNAPNATLRFDGGSSYMLWGALLVNAEETRSPVAMLELLAHEAAHLLLYAATQEEPLVHNDPEQRYPSPLREDLRPMDGIYHATWVSARMAWAMQQVASHPSTPVAQASEAQTALQHDLANFRAGYDVVMRHGVLSATGQQVMSSAASWVATLPHRP